MGWKATSTIATSIPKRHHTAEREGLPPQTLGKETKAGEILHDLLVEETLQRKEGMEQGGLAAACTLTEIP